MKLVQFARAPSDVGPRPRGPIVCRKVRGDGAPPFCVVPVTIGALFLPLVLAGCTLRDRNQLALALCERNVNCATSAEREPSGPPQVRALENPPRPSATARKK